MKRVHILITSVILLLCVGFAVLYASGTIRSVDSSDQAQEMKKTIEAAELAQIYPDSVLNRKAADQVFTSASEEMQTEQARQSAVSEFKASSDDYFAKGSPLQKNCVENLNAMIANLSADADTPVSDTVDAGILECTVDSIDRISSDEADVSFTLVSWIKSVDSTDGLDGKADAKFTSYAAANRETRTVRMKKENGVWKEYESVESMELEMAPEDFDDGRGFYQTYEDALDGILSFEVKNPFE